VVRIRKSLHAFLPTILTLYGEMIDFWTDFVSQVITRIRGRVQIDRVRISEDMAYKAHSMISPAMVRRFLMPTYHRWVSEIRDAGCALIDVDSDGYIEDLIPMWIEVGINACEPMEVAPRNDNRGASQTFRKTDGFLWGNR